MMTPKFKLLKDAYAIVYGIPEDVIALDSLIKCKGDSLECGTVACAFGWLGMHPTFKKLMNPTPGYFPDWVINGETHVSYAQAAAALFGISPQDGRNLFSVAFGSRYDIRGDGRSDKARFLHRMKSFLKEQGQWKGLTKRKGSVPC